MPHTKTPGGQAASDKYQKQEAAAKGHGAENAPGHTEGKAPGEAPVAGDSYTSTSGVDPSANNPGEKGNIGTIVGEKPSDTINQGNMKN